MFVLNQMKLKFIASCQIFVLNDPEDNVGDDNNIFTNINSKYDDMHEINKLKNKPSSLKLLHTIIWPLYPSIMMILN